MSASVAGLDPEMGRSAGPSVARWAESAASPPVELPRRLGEPPLTRMNPHVQLNQRPTWDAVERVYSAAVALPGVQSRGTSCGPAGTIALRVSTHGAANHAGAPRAFLSGDEFVHLHPLPHGSVHVVLPAELRHAAIAAGWAEPHPLAGQAAISPLAVMVYAPRTRAEADVVAHLVRVSWEMAVGVRR